MNNWKKAMALALGLPSTILGSFLLLQQLIQKKVISQTLGLMILVIIVISILVKMIRIQRKK